MRPAKLASFVFGLVVFAALGACSGDSPSSQLRLSGMTMGTSYHITLVADIESDSRRARQIQAGVDELLRNINQSMSTYIPDSEINRLGEATPGSWVTVSGQLMNVLSLSQEVSQLSAGAFDITIRPLIDLWGFGPQKTQDVVPDAETIASLRSAIGYKFLLLDEQNHRVKRLTDISLDLSAVAKGYAVDRVANYLVEQGFNNLLVEIGGEMALRGHSAHGNLWRIAVERPQTGLAGDAYKAIQLTDVGLATSGDYRNYFEQDGVRYSHTLDPRSGYPITHNLASVTVIDTSSARADALATAFNVLGVEQALPLANSVGIAALFIIKRGDGFAERASEAFKPYLDEREQ